MKIIPFLCLKFDWLLYLKNRSNYGIIRLNINKKIGGFMNNQDFDKLITVQKEEIERIKNSNPEINIREFYLNNKALRHRQHCPLQSLLPLELQQPQPSQPFA